MSNPLVKLLEIFTAHPHISDGVVYHRPGLHFSECLWYSFLRWQPLHSIALKSTLEVLRSGRRHLAKNRGKGVSEEFLVSAWVACPNVSLV